MIEAERSMSAIYAETAAFYAAHRQAISPDDLGYRVLYGPPYVGAPILFIGFQPGGRKNEAEESRAAGHRDHWPAASDYVTAEWPLAMRMRKLWGEEVIARCVGTNAIFFRATTARDWKKLDRAATNEAERFSRERVEKIAKALHPGRIVLIGLGTFNILIPGGGEVALQSGTRVLAKAGELWGIPATGVIHLSGARISGPDLGLLQSFFAAEKS